MTTRIPSSRAVERVNSRRIWLAGLVGILAAIVANLIVRALLFAALPLPENFPPLQVGSIIFFTVVFGVLATIVFSLVARFSARPVSTYKIIALVALIVSVLPNFAAMANPAAMPFPGGTPVAFGALIVFHVVGAAAIVTALLLLTRPERSSDAG